MPRSTRCSRRRRGAEPRSPDRRHPAPRHPAGAGSRGGPRLRPGAHRAPGDRADARDRRPQPGPRLADRPGLPRHDDAARDPAQHLREPGLVHRLLALPAGDQPGAARGADQLPDAGLRPHRPRRGQCLAARRGHRRGRGDGHGPPRRGLEGRCVLRRSRLPAPDHRRAAHAGRADGLAHRRRRPLRRPRSGRGVRRRSSSIPASAARSTTSRSRSRPCTRPAPSRRSPPTRWR